MVDILREKSTIPPEKPPLYPIPSLFAIQGDIK